MKKIISFSLWGTDMKYCQGAIENVKLAKELYPDFTCYFWIDALVPPPIEISLSQYDNAKVTRINKIGTWQNGLFWRFKPLYYNKADIVLVRDTDSRLNEREKQAVDEWSTSDKLIHTIKDHNYHIPYRLMPGLLGFKKELFIEITRELNDFNSSDDYGTDYQIFNKIYSQYCDKIMIHGFGGLPLKIPRDKKNYFVGEVFDENNIPNSEHRGILKNYLLMKSELDNI